MIYPHKNPKHTKSSEFSKGIKNIHSLIDELDVSLSKSAQLDRQIVMTMKINQLHNQNTVTRLSEAQTENKQLLSMLQLDNEDGRNVPRTNSNTSCSTMSLVHLQYKYEELVANQNGLLKILDMRHNEIRQSNAETLRLKEEIENLKFIIQKYEIEFTKLLEQVKVNKNKKNKKIHNLKTERDTLRLVHNRFVNLLTQLSMEKDSFLLEQLHNTSHSEKALLLQEVRKNNNLMYENFQLQQKVEYLQSQLTSKKWFKRDVSSSISGTSSNLSH